jgi:hypothetical protein
MHDKHTSSLFFVHHCMFFSLQCSSLLSHSHVGSSHANNPGVDDELEIQDSAPDTQDASPHTKRQRASQKTCCAERKDLIAEPLTQFTYFFLCNDQATFPENFFYCQCLYMLF